MKQILLALGAVGFQFRSVISRGGSWAFRDAPRYSGDTGRLDHDHHRNRDFGDDRDWR